MVTSKPFFLKIPASTPTQTTENDGTRPQSAWVICSSALAFVPNNPTASERTKMSKTWINCRIMIPPRFVAMVRPDRGCCPIQLPESCGFLRYHPAACSYLAATCRTVLSSNGRPTICSPTGCPAPVNPQQTLIAGWPVTLNGTVLKPQVLPRASRNETFSPSISVTPRPHSSIFGAGIDTGVTITSTRSNARSNSSASRRRTRCAVT